MENKSVIQSKIELLQEYLAFLEESKNYKESEFIQSKLIHGSVERYLHLSIEATIDIGNHIISKNGWGSVHWYQDIAAIFQEKGYIDSDLCALWIKMIRFRNLLVHEYAKIDKKEVYNVLQNHLIDIVRIQKMFVERFL